MEEKRETEEQSLKDILTEYETTREVILTQDGDKMIAEKFHVDDSGNRTLITKREGDMSFAMLIIECAEQRSIEWRKSMNEKRLKLIAHEEEFEEMKQSTNAVGE